MSDESVPANDVPFKKAYFSALNKKYPSDRNIEESKRVVSALNKDFSNEHLENLSALFKAIPTAGFDPDSPERMLPHLFGDKWTPLLMMIISTGTIRYAALKRSVSVFSNGDEISKFMLTKKLRELERNGLLIRRQTDDVPPKVDYTLTALGYGVIDKLIGLFGYIHVHTAEINAARAIYDSKEK